MTNFKQLLIMATLALAFSSQSALAGGTVTKSPSPLSHSGDPMLMAGLGRNPADCPFKSQAGKNDDTAGVLYGKARTASGSSETGTGNR